MELGSLIQFNFGTKLNILFEYFTFLEKAQKSNPRNTTHVPQLMTRQHTDPGFLDLRHSLAEHQLTVSCCVRSMCLWSVCGVWCVCGACVCSAVKPQVLFCSVLGSVRVHLKRNDLWSVRSFYHETRPDDLPSSRYLWSILHEEQPLALKCKLRNEKIWQVRVKDERSLILSDNNVAWRKGLFITPIRASDRKWSLLRRILQTLNRKGTQ